MPIHSIQMFSHTVQVEMLHQSMQAAFKWQFGLNAFWQVAKHKLWKQFKHITTVNECFQSFQDCVNVDLCAFSSIQSMT